MGVASSLGGDGGTLGITPHFNLLRKASEQGTRRRSANAQRHAGARVEKANSSDAKGIPWRRASPKCTSSGGAGRCIGVRPINQPRQTGLIDRGDRADCLTPICNRNPYTINRERPQTTATAVIAIGFPEELRASEQDCER